MVFLMYSGGIKKEHWQEMGKNRANRQYEQITW